MKEFRPYRQLLCHNNFSVQLLLLTVIFVRACVRVCVCVREREREREREGGREGGREGEIML